MNDGCVMTMTPMIHKITPIFCLKLQMGCDNMKYAIMIANIGFVATIVIASPTGRYDTASNTVHDDTLPMKPRRMIFIEVF